MGKGATVAAALIGGAGAIGLTAWAVGRAKGVPPAGSLSITALPGSLPSSGGSVAVTATATGIAVGTSLTIYANGVALTSAPLPADGTLPFTWVAPPNAGATAVVDALQVKAGSIVSNTANVTVVGATAARYHVRGDVVDAAGAGIVGAAVKLIGKQRYFGTTRLGGRYDFLGVAPGAYTLTASATGYVTKSLAVTVVATDVMDPALVLT